MTRHASAEDLASLDLDALKARKAARIRSHVAGCVRCTQLSGQVAAVPTTLASVSYPAMSTSMATQLDAALASESASRVASAPATEAGRRDLPERGARPSRGGWQFPRLPSLATRLVVAAGALVVVGAGTYQLVAHTGGSSSGTAASSAGSANVPSARQMTLGPTVQFGPASAPKTIRIVRSATNFTAADLGAQAVGAVQAAKHEGASAAQPARGAAPAATAAAPTSSSVQSQASSPSSLPSCLEGIAGNQPVLLVEIANYEGKPATIIVTAASGTRPGEVWVVGPACSASHPDVYTHQALSGT